MLVRFVAIPRNGLQEPESAQKAAQWGIAAGVTDVAGLIVSKPAMAHSDEYSRPVLSVKTSKRQVLLDVMMISA